MSVKMKYSCSYCRSVYDTEQECLKCVESCVIDDEVEKELKARLYQIRYDIRLLKAKSENDVDNCQDLLGGRLIQFDYEDYTYPIDLIIVTEHTKDPWDGCEETNLIVMPKQEYIEQQRGYVEAVVDRIESC